MKFVTCLSLSLWLGLAAPVWAQAADPSESTESTPSTAAADLTITPRVGGSVSTSGSGTPRFTQLEGLIPVWQDPGTSLTFVEAHLLWLDYETLGTNLVLGQRFFDAAGDRLFGGYLAYDTRDTGNNRFHQIGVGFERLSDTWDLRLNGFFPVGETEQAVDGAAGLGASNLRFERNFLLFDETRPLEVALLSLDGEVGGKLVDLNDFAELRGYGGLYWLDGGDTSVVGWRARLEARAQERYTLGLSVQDDNRFGTNVIFRLGVSFGGVPQTVPREEVPPTYLRAGDFVARNNAIVVDEQTEAVETTALNPETGEPWIFQHVGNTGGSEGDGTFENPFGTIVAGIGEAGSNGTDNRNEIVYVQFGSNPTNLSEIAIPDNIQLLSIAPTQSINTQLGTVQLPLSGAGTSQRPQLNATVNIGNNTVLSGFDINNVAGNGILAENVTGFTIEENSIRNITRFGILGGVINGSTVSGISITDNTITDVTGFDGIFFGAANGSTISDVTISGNTISNVARDGIAVGATNSSTLSLATITNNTISNTGRFGVGLGVDTDVSNAFPGVIESNNSTVNAIVTNNRISDAGTDAANTTRASIGVSTQDANSRVCFQLSSNESLNPPSPNAALGFSNPLDILFINILASGAIDAANFEIVDRDNLTINNTLAANTIDMLTDATGFPPFTITNDLTITSTVTASCP